jgi:transcriptional regulator GlxA family with amidase domain
MSERTFRRASFAETAETSRAFVERIRIEAARQMLECKLPLQTVARRCGLETMDTLRRAFVRRFGITPERYRERFY